MERYVARIADTQLADRLTALGAVVIEGPKACGKTATARQLAASEVLLDVDVDAARAASIDPGLILTGPVPRLLDEWQRAGPDVEPSRTRERAGVSTGPPLRNR